MQKNKQKGVSLLTCHELAIVRMIKARTSRGETLERISKTSRISYVLIRRLAHLSQIRYKGRRASPESIRGATDFVRKQGGTIREAAAKFGMSKTAVQRFLAKLRIEAVNSAGEIVFQDGMTKYSKNKQSWTCPEHGRITIWPCVQCLALASRGQRRGTNRASG